jgi:sugar lactone lactonase YvrE
VCSEGDPMKSKRRWYLVIGGAAVVVIAAVVVSVVLFTGGGNKVTPIPGMENPDESRQVTNQVWPAPLALAIPIDAKQIDQPVDLAVIDGTMYIADPTGGRIVQLSADGKTFTVLDKQIDPKLTLNGPMAITSFQGQLYVLDSGGDRVLVVSPSGTVSKVMTLAKGASSDPVVPRPLGIAVTSDGSLVVSDGDNHRLIKYGPDGGVVWTVGTGARETVDKGFNNPVGVALDQDGNIYVVDGLNGQVKKFSSDGKFLLGFGHAGDRAGDLARPKAVAVDNLGNVYVSDGLGAAVDVFDKNGNFAGFIGRKTPSDPNSTSLFQAPHGLKIVDGKLYVVDRFQGIFEFTLPSTQPATPSTQSTPTSAAE